MRNSNRRLWLGSITLGWVVGTTGACGACANQNSPDHFAPFNHDKFFVVNGSHQDFTCDQCHPPGAPSFSSAADGVDCLGCHTESATAPFHAGVTGYLWATPACIPCHKSGSVAFDHAKFFPIGPTAVHAGLACNNCHGATQAVADLQCTSCHNHDQPTMDADHSGLAGYTYSSAACYNCHPDSSIPPFDHSVFPIAAGTVHATFSCPDCHGATHAAADLQCTSCHTGAHVQGDRRIERWGRAIYLQKSAQGREVVSEGACLAV